MKKTFIIFIAFLSVFLLSFIEKTGYNINDKVENFTLKNIDGQMVSLSDYASKKGVAVIFTCNHCPYSVMYEDRIKDIHNRFSTVDLPVIAINPNDPEVQPKDSFENMQIRAKEKDFQFAYLLDEGQKIFPKFGATKTPHVFLLKNEGGAFIVKYIGAIDDNAQDVTKIENNYLMNAMNAILSNQEIEMPITKAVGCSIKIKK
jgi:peroxiredoxin